MKKHIVFAWELGGGYGHIAGISPFASQLIDSDFKVSIIANNVNSTALITKDMPVEIYQAPFYRKAKEQAIATYTYPEILLELGYQTAKNLEPVVEAWCNLLRLLSPDLLIADHSPSALVACRILNIKTALIGTGFFSPPRVSPLPIFIGMAGFKQQEVWNHEQLMLESINQVLTNNKSQPLQHVYELFNVDEDFLCTFAELDHYPDRAMSKYWGPRFDLDTGSNFKWPNKSNKRIFAYIKQETPDFDLLLEALISSGHSIVLHIPNANSAVKSLCAKRKQINLVVSPANMRQVLDESDLVVCHAGHGVLAAALLKGVRLLLVPSQLEQSMLTYQIARKRLAMAINPRDKNANYKKAIEFALSNVEMATNLALFKEKYADFSHDQQLVDMVKACENISN